MIPFRRPQDKSNALLMGAPVSDQADAQTQQSVRHGGGPGANSLLTGSNVQTGRSRGPSRAARAARQAYEQELLAAEDTGQPRRQQPQPAMPLHSETSMNHHPYPLPHAPMPSGTHYPAQGHSGMQQPAGYGPAGMTQAWPPAPQPVAYHPAPAIAGGHPQAGAPQHQAPQMQMMQPAPYHHPHAQLPAQPMDPWHYQGQPAMVPQPQQAPAHPQTVFLQPIYVPMPMPQAAPASVPAVSHREPQPENTYRPANDRQPTHGGQHGERQYTGGQIDHDRDNGEMEQMRQSLRDIRSVVDELTRRRFG